MQKNVSVVLTAPYTAECTEKVLLGYNAQTYRNFEVLLVISSSDTEIPKVVETLKKELFFSVTTVSVQKDIAVSGDFSEIVNAIATDYVIFASASGIPRYDFVEQHVKYREEGFFLSGNCKSINEKVLGEISQGTINSGVCFELNWLKKKGFASDILDKMRFSEGLLGSFLNKLFNKNLVFSFVNSSLWRDDLEKVLNSLAHKKQGKSALEITNEMALLSRRGKQVKYSTLLLLPKKG